MERYGKKQLNAKTQSQFKVFKKSCNFIRPARIMKDGRMVTTKICSAYIPSFEVGDMREPCEQCNVPDYSVIETRCRYFAPLELTDTGTIWVCRLLGVKNLQSEQCTPERCNFYSKCENLKWEIGKPLTPEERAKASQNRVDNPPQKSKRMFPKSVKQIATLKKEKKEDFGTTYMY